MKPHAASGTPRMIPRPIAAPKGAEKVGAALAALVGRAWQPCMRTARERKRKKEMREVILGLELE